MKQGKCTNLPTECTKAASGELQNMPTDDTRCAECNSLLTVQSGQGNFVFTDHSSSGNTQRDTAKIAVFSLIGLILLGGVGFAGYKFMNKDKTDTPVVTKLEKPNPTTSDKSNNNNNATAKTSANTSNAQVKMNIQGSNTLGAELMPKLIQAYENQQGNKPLGDNDVSADDKKLVFQDKQNQTFAIDIGSHGSSTGFEALMNGKADFAMSSREIKADEMQALQAKGLGNMKSPTQEMIVGVDGIAIIVHPSNPIEKLTMSQLRDVFSGKIKDWSQIGAKAGAINLYVRDKKSGTRDFFDEKVLNKIPANASNSKEFEDSHKLSSAVSSDPNAIGYIGLPYVNNAKLLAIADSENSIPMKPTAFTTSTEDYVLSRRLYVYLPQNATSDARGLVNFIMSKDGQAIVEQAGFTQLKPKTIAVAKANNGEIATYKGNNSGYQSLQSNAERVNTNFRFAFASSELDNRAKQDISRIGDMVKSMSGSGEDKRLILVGFADNKGSECGNNRIALERARIVAQALATYGIKADVVEGMGSEAPVADNATDAGREKNRRVELWVAPLQSLPRFPVKAGCN